MNTECNAADHDLTGSTGGSPAHQTSTVTRDMIRFFILSWESTCQEIEQDGNVVVRGTPEIPPTEGR